MRHSSQKRRTLSTHLMAVTALLGGLSCAVENEEGVRVAEQSFMYQPSSLWNLHAIPVCFETSGWSTEKNWTRQVLKGQGSWEDAGSVNFVGFGDCGQLDNGVRITLDPSPDARTQSELGPNWGPPAQTVLMTLGVQLGVEEECAHDSIHSFTREQCFKQHVLHEFGHAVGLYHEHQRRLRGDPLPAGCEDRAQSIEDNEVHGNFDINSIMVYSGGICQPRRTTISSLDARGIATLYGKRDGASNHLVDYNGDGRDDLLCHDTIVGTKVFDYAWGEGEFNGPNVTPSATWCKGDGAKLFRGDFDGDGLADLLCHHLTTGKKFIDYAAGGFNGTNWRRTGALWCGYPDPGSPFHAFGELHIGDFNGDGRDDMLCRSRSGSTRRVDYASTTGRFLGTDHTTTAQFCDPDSDIYVGDFNGDNRDDMLCHNPDGGSFSIDYASSIGQLGSTNWTSTSSFCSGAPQQLFVGDFNGDGLDDLLCHDYFTGTKDIDYSSGVINLPFDGTDWFQLWGWCGHNTERLFVGDVNGDDRDDLVCHNVENGSKWVDLADGNGEFHGSNLSRHLGFCMGDEFILR